MGIEDIIDTIEGTGISLNSIKKIIENKPKQSFTAGFIGVGVAGLTYSLVTKDYDSIGNSLSSFGRALSFNANDIVGHSLNNFQAVYDSVKDSGASRSMITDDGLSGLKTGLGLACVGIVKVVYPPADSNIKEKKYFDLETETHKSGKGKAIVFLGIAIVGAAIAGYYSLAGDTPVVDQKVSDSNPPYLQSDTPATDTETVVEPVTVSNPETPIEAEAPISETVPVAESAETPWYVDRTGFEDAEVGTYSTMFGEDVYAVKKIVDNGDGYNIFDIESSERILKHQEWTPSNFRLDLELSSDQYRALNDQYGTMISATMETIDNDPTRAGMDKVAIHYEGTGGEWTEEFNYDKRADVEDYMIAHISPEIYPSLIID